MCFRDQGGVNKNFVDANYLGGSTYNLDQLAEHWDGLPVHMKIPMRLVRFYSKHIAS